VAGKLRLFPVTDSGESVRLQLNHGHSIFHKAGCAEMPGSGSTLDFLQGLSSQNACGCIDGEDVFLMSPVVS